MELGKAVLRVMRCFILRRFVQPVPPPSPQVYQIWSALHVRRFSLVIRSYVNVNVSSCSEQQQQGHLHVYNGARCVHLDVHYLAYVLSDL